MKYSRVLFCLLFLFSCGCGKRLATSGNPSTTASDQTSSTSTSAPILTSNTSSTTSKSSSPSSTNTTPASSNTIAPSQSTTPTTVVVPKNTTATPPAPTGVLTPAAPPASAPTAPVLPPTVTIERQDPVTSVGQTIFVRVRVAGVFTKVTFNNKVILPTPYIDVPLYPNTDKPTQYTATAIAEGPGGVGQASTTFEVPTCVHTVTSATISGLSTATLISGPATKITVDGQIPSNGGNPVPFTQSKNIAPGSYGTSAIVYNSVGDHTGCSAAYQVTPPPVCRFTDPNYHETFGDSGDGHAAFFQAWNILPTNVPVGLNVNASYAGSFARPAGQIRSIEVNYYAIAQNGRAVDFPACPADSKCILYSVGGDPNDYYARWATTTFFARIARWSSASCSVTDLTYAYDPRVAAQDNIFTGGD